MLKAALVRGRSSAHHLCCFVESFFRENLKILTDESTEKLNNNFKKKIFFLNFAAFNEQYETLNFVRRLDKKGYIVM
uniref:Uncharacterized protein n=1 Tax=Romanomermis culicivorax TaxID=13658 RepID=A0A915KGG7_ROMCU